MATTEPEMSKYDYTYGRIAYEAYCEETRDVQAQAVAMVVNWDVVSWDRLGPSVQRAWAIAAGKAIDTFAQACLV